MKKILAKTIPREETLESHLKNTVDIWKILKEKYSYFIEDREFWRNSLISVIFHDFGKLSENFQNTMNKVKGAKENHIRHELLSGVYLFLNEENREELKLWILAVFSHHKKFSEDGMIKSFKNDAHRKLSIDIENINQITSFIEKHLKNSNHEFTINSRLNDYFLSTDLESIYKNFNFILSQSKKKIKERDRIEYLMYKGILNISDWIASGNKKYIDGIEYNKDFLETRIVNKLKEENKKEIAKKFKFRDFQLESINNNNVIAIAPTGSGKTEASLLWASDKKKNERIIYLLPTRVTSNSIYKRLTTYFGEDYTAVIHSSAFFLRKEINGKYESSEYLKDKTFFRNVNICTIDQILTQGFNLGFWEIKTFNMIKSKVIIDEIHIYQPYTLGLIISTVKYLKENFGVTFYIMSATMPKKLKKLLHKTLGKETILIQDKELLEKERNIFEARDIDFDELDKEILNKIKERKKILIVVNTVNEAIRIYKKYKDFSENVICYHSRFMQKDRLQKENEILNIDKTNEPVLLIATQVVEVSLDIDFDILYTENAPIDAIIQRAGRVNRKRLKEETKVVVFKHSEITEKYVYNNKEILDKSFEIIKMNNGKKMSEKNLNKYVDEVYKDFNVEENQNFIKGLNKYWEVQEKLSFIMDNSGDMDVFTRENLNTENIIPFKFWSELENKEIEEIVKYEISIRKKKRTFEYRDGFKYLIDCNYSYEVGLEFKDDEEKVMSF